MKENACELLNKSLIHKIITKWECRHFDSKYDDLITLLAVAIYFDRCIYPAEIEAAHEILKKHLKHEDDLHCAMESLNFKLQEYVENDLSFLLDREKALDIIVDNIQSYGDMKEIFEADGELSELEKSIEDVIKKEFDRKWSSKKAYGVDDRMTKWKN